MYIILILPLISGVISQVLKFFIKTNHQKLSFKSIITYAGMPSGHSAMTVSLTTIIFLKQGLGSPLFAFSLIFAIIIIRDALGLRRYLGQHGKVLNILVKDLRDDAVLEEKYPHLLESIGHTPKQVIVGSLIGFLVSLFGYILF